MIKSHIIKLYPIKSQEIFFKKSCGIARFSYNWALNRWNELYKNNEICKGKYQLCTEFQAFKQTEGYEWIKEVGKTVPQYAIYNVEKAFKNFFAKRTDHPKFKKKGSKDSFVSIEKIQDFKQKDFKIWVPRLGWVKCAENLRFEGQIMNVIIKRTADMWFAVVNIKVKNKIPNETSIVRENQAIVGVDLGIKLLAVTSEGQIFTNPKALKNNLKSLKRLQRGFTRKEKGSKNQKKQQMKLARKHYKVSCLRKTKMHQATVKIVDSADVIVLEDLNVIGMLKNHNLAQAIGDASFSEFRRQIEYKAAWAGKEVIIADRWFASSKICSCCGHTKDDLKLSDRIYKCSNCGLRINRDLNSAKNLAAYGIATLKTRESQACGEGNSSVVSRQSDSPSMKQELKLNCKSIKT